MDYEKILYDVEDGIATVTLNRPKVMNAMDPQMMSELRSAFDVIRDDKDVRVVVLTGSGAAFCAGADLGTLSLEKPDLRKDRNFLQGNMRFLMSVMNLEKLVIAAVNGHAIGGGCNMALACDFVISSENAIFSQIQTKVGLAPDMGGAYFLIRLVGMNKAREMCFTGKMVSAQEALKMGLIYKVVPREHLIPEAKKMAVEFRRGPTIALGYTKRLLNKAVDLDIVSEFDYELEMQMVCQSTKDFTEGVRAFMEKREPTFEGQ
jgi:2-(1,2-epoxy-1,2-dihydrophenyl)acetyl-CoA isomerase